MTGSNIMLYLPALWFFQLSAAVIKEISPLTLTSGKTC